MQKTLLVILDGLGDRPIKAFGGKTHRSDFPESSAHPPRLTLRCLLTGISRPQEVSILLVSLFRVISEHWFA